jgi:predicted GNAT family acetyltransferase
MDFEEKPMKWYAQRSSGSQGIVINEADGRTVAVTYDMDDVVLVASAPELLTELRRTQLMLMYAAQEAKGKVKKEIVDSWIYQVGKAGALFQEATMDIKEEKRWIS